MTEQRPQPPDEHAGRSWLRGFLRRSPPAAGDVFATNIEGGARGNAVGKYFIQIGSLNIPLWAVLALIAVVAGGLGYIGWRLTPARQTAMTGSLRVAVAPFTQPPFSLLPPSGNQDTISSLIAEALDNQREVFRTIDSAGSAGVRIWPGQDNPGASLRPILEDDERRQRAAAEELAGDVNADVVIYGTLNKLGELLPKFYVAPRFDTEVGSIVGHYQLGQAPLRWDEDDPGGASAALNTRASALFWVVVGIDYLRRGDAAGALRVLDDAQQALVTRDGQDLLHYFKGQAYIYQMLDTGGRPRCAERDALLLLAEQEFREALEINPGYWRAQISLGSIHYYRALCAAPSERLASGQLELAAAEYEKARALAAPTEDAALAAQTIAYAGSVLASLAGATHDTFARGASDPALRDGEYAQALGAYESAIAILRPAADALAELNDPRMLALANRALGVAQMRSANLARDLEKKPRDEIGRLYEDAAARFQECVAQGDRAPNDLFLTEKVIGDGAGDGCAAYAGRAQETLQQLKEGTP